MNENLVTNPSRDELLELIGNESGICVTIMMRTHSSGPETTQNPIRFKNAITEAIEKVGDRDEDVREKLADLSKLEHDFEFWQHQSAGFALFVCRDFVKHFGLTHAPDDVVHVAEHFYTVPIAAKLCGGGGTRAVALSWDRARLYACDGQEANEIVDDRFPVTMDQLVTERDPEEQLQFSTHSTKGGGPSGPGDNIGRNVSRSWRRRR